jgi:hypothetical protein
MGGSTSPLLWYDVASHGRETKHAVTLEPQCTVNPNPITVHGWGTGPLQPRDQFYGAAAVLRIPETTMGDNDVPVAVRSHLVQAASGPTEAAGGGDDFAWFYDEDTYENAAPILMHEEEEEASLLDDIIANLQMAE